MSISIFAAEHELLRESLERFGERVLDPGLDDWEAQRQMPEDVFTQLGSLGGAEIAGDPIAGVVLAEALGRWGGLGASTALLDDALGRAVLGGAAPAHGPVALIEWPTALHGPLTGTASCVVNGVSASVLVLIGADNELGVLDPLAGAVRVAPVATPLGCMAAGQARIELGGALLHQRLGPHGGQTRQQRWLLEAAAATATAHAVWDDAHRYSLQREAFGRPIGRFQVNRHALAELATRCSAATQLVHDAAWRLAHGGAGADTQVALARSYARRTAVETADRCLQLYGGYGYSMEFPVQRAWRDAHHLRATGDDEPVRERIAAALRRPREVSP